MPSGDIHNYGRCWCGRDHQQSIWQDGYDAGYLAGAAFDPVIATPRDALDVERLARAVIAASGKGAWSVYRTEGGVSWMDRREVAAAIAREYAALAATEGEA